MADDLVDLDPEFYGFTMKTLMKRALAGTFPEIFHPRGSKVYRVKADALAEWERRECWIRKHTAVSGTATRLPRPDKRQRSSRRSG